MTELERQQEMALIAAWVEQIPQKQRMASNFNSYYLKHLAERKTGAYVANEEFHGIMKRRGFRWKQDGDSPNYLYNLSAKWVREYEAKLMGEEDEARQELPRRNSVRI